jgi:hypothetical protein
MVLEGLPPTGKDLVMDRRGQAVGGETQGVLVGQTMKVCTTPDV